MNKEFRRCRPWIEELLRLSGRRRSVDEIEQAIREKKMLLIGLRHGAVLVYLHETPRLRALYAIVCGDDFGEMREAIAELAAQARSSHCRRLVILVKQEWTAGLADLDFATGLACVTKEIPLAVGSHDLTRLPAKFLDRIEFTDKCWLWKGKRGGLGYGFFRQGSKLQPAHRYSYRHLVGPIPPSLVLDHRCEVKNCVNPDHLEPVTAAENTRRGSFGKHNLLKTHCPKGHPYSGDNLRIINGRERRCRTCVRESVRRRYYAAKSAKTRSAQARRKSISRRQ